MRLPEIMPEIPFNFWQCLRGASTARNSLYKKCISGIEFLAVDALGLRINVLSPTRVIDLRELLCTGCFFGHASRPAAAGRLDSENGAVAQLRRVVGVAVELA